MGRSRRRTTELGWRGDEKPRSGRGWRRAIVAVVLLSVLGCQGPGRGKGEEEDDEPEAAPVEVTTLERGPMEAVLTFTADLEAEIEVPVVSRVAQRVARLEVEEGDAVARGQLLAKLEDVEPRSALAKVESQLEQARQEFARQERLFAQELVSEQTITDAAHELEQLEIARDDARQQLSYTEIRAPIAGTVSARLVNIGDQVGMNGEVFRIVDLDSLVARVYVPERDLGRVGVGQPARLESQALPGVLFEGRVDRIAPVVDPRTGTVKVTIVVPHRPGLLPGMFLEVELVVAVESAALLVPKRALVMVDNQAFVFRLTDEDTVERLAVVPSLEDAVNVRIEDPLTPGDRLVVAGQGGLKDGDAVRVVGGGE